MRFLDTNVLLYAISRDPAEERKAAIAIQLLDSPAPGLGLSAQVLQEFYVQATRPSRTGSLPAPLALEYIEIWQDIPLQETTAALVRAAIGCSTRYLISYWDAAIVEAARALRCDTVLSEDLGDGQDYGGVRVQNPFRVGRKAAHRP